MITRAIWPTTRMLPTLASTVTGRPGWTWVRTDPAHGPATCWLGSRSYFGENGEPRSGPMHEYGPVRHMGGSARWPPRFGWGRASPALVESVRVWPVSYPNMHGTGLLERMTGRYPPCQALALHLMCSSSARSAHVPLHTRVYAPLQVPALDVRRLSRLPVAEPATSLPRLNNVCRPADPDVVPDRGCAQDPAAPVRHLWQSDWIRGLSVGCPLDRKCLPSCGCPASCGCHAVGACLPACHAT